MRQLVTLLLLSLAMAPFALPASAMMVAVSEPELVATSDLIVLGTISAVSQIPDVPNWYAGRATIQLERVLKGAAPESVDIVFPTVPVMPPGTVIVDHGGMSFTVGQQQIFFLQRAQQGYGIVGNYQGVRKPDEAQHFTSLIKEQVVVANIEGSPGPFLLGQQSVATFTLKNISLTKNVRVTYTYPEAFFLSERMGSYVSITVVPENDGRPFLPPGAVIPIEGVGQNMEGNAVGKVQVNAIGRINQPVVQEIKPGTSLTVKMKLRPEMPQGWQFFAGTFIQTPIVIRMKSHIQVTDPTDPRDVVQNYQVATPWGLALLGYPQPELP